MSHPKRLTWAHPDTATSHEPARRSARLPIVRLRGRTAPAHDRESCAPVAVSRCTRLVSRMAAGTLFAASEMTIAVPPAAQAQVAPGPYEMLPYQEGFIVEAFKDLRTGFTNDIADWTGWSAANWVSPDAYDEHIGTDVSVQTGTPLYASAAGRVTEAVNGFPQNDHSTYCGNYAKIAVTAASPNGEAIDLTYCHMLSVSVSVGQHVNVGDFIGLSDNTGNSTSEHVHFQTEIRGGAQTCPFYWAHFKYPIMFNTNGLIQIGRVIKVRAASTPIRTDRFDSSSQITTAWQNQLYFCSYPKRGYYQIFIPNNTSYRSGWIRATAVDEVFSGTVIQPLPDNVTFTQLGQLSAPYPIRSAASDSASQIGQIVFGGGRFVADQVTNGFYRIPLPGASAAWGWVKPTSRMIVYPQLTNPNLNLASLPNNNFPLRESFPTVGKSMFGRPKFNRSVVNSFSPSSPGGDGKALFVTDITNFGQGTSESVLVGKPGHTNYYVQCDVYFNYRPAYVVSDGGYERYGIFLRDDGFAGLDTTFEGAGNAYAFLWDADDGRLRAAKLVDAAITDFFPSATYVTSGGWHTMRIEARTNQIKFFLDGVLRVQTNDSTFASGQCGLGYIQHFNGNPSGRGAYFDNFAADSLEPQIITPPQSQTAQLSSNVTFTVSATGAAPLSYQWYFWGTNAQSGATGTNFTLSSVGFAKAGNYSVVVSNAYGTSTGGPAVLTVVDTIPPSITSCPSNRTLAAEANSQAVLPDLTGQVAATDASGAVTVTQNPPGGTTVGLGATNVTFTARDSSSNTSSCVATLTVLLPPAPTISFDGTKFILMFPTAAGVGYALEYKYSLDDPSWQVLTNVSGTGSPFTITDYGPTNETKFYRVRVE